MENPFCQQFRGELQGVGVIPSSTGSHMEVYLNHLLSIWIQHLSTGMDVALLGELYLRDPTPSI